MKTPEEIKKGIETHVKLPVPCEECLYYEHQHNYQCTTRLLEDALVYIERLEKERDEWKCIAEAAKEDCGRFPCSTCLEHINSTTDMCAVCAIKQGDTRRSRHELRGLCTENGGTE